MVAVGVISVFILAFLWGRIEGMWINRRTRANLPSLTRSEHLGLGIGRFFVVMVAAVTVCLLYHADLKEAFRVMILVGMLFIPAERLTKNITRHQAFNAIGWDRMGNDGYDGVWMWLVARYQRAAILAATVVEVGVAVVAAILLR